MSLFKILDALEYLGLKDCRLGAYSSVSKKMKDKTDDDFMSRYVIKTLSHEISKYLSEKIIIYKSDSSDDTKDTYSTELFIFTKDELIKFVKEVNK